MLNKIISFLFVNIFLELIDYLKIIDKKFQFKITSSKHEIFGEKIVPQIRFKNLLQVNLMDGRCFFFFFRRFKLLFFCF